MTAQYTVHFRNTFLTSGLSQEAGVASPFLNGTYSLSFNTWHPDCGS